jgi:KaiC/GvpD/RAD55 family RecA-like ATPase
MSPPSKFECPRCGFGIRPGDLQCGRCGEDLRTKTPNQPVQVDLTSINLNRSKVEECSRVRLRSVEAIPVSRPDSSLQMRIDELDRRERVLRERERMLSARSEELEEHATALESSGKEKASDFSYDMDELRQKVREEFVRQFEPEIEALQHQLEEKESLLQEAQLRADMLEGGPPSPPELDKDELARISEEIFQELQSQVGRLPEVTDPGVLRTNIGKLDDMLGGGIPQGHTVLFNGAPGTMKSTLAFTILYRSAVKDRLPGLYLSLEQSGSSILRQMEKMGMPLAQAEGRLKVADLRDLRKEMVEEEGNWRQLLLGYVQRMQREMNFKVFVLDSLESFRAVTEHRFDRQDLKDLFDWFKSLGITVLVISENTSTEWEESDQGEAYLSDGIMELLMREMSDSRVQRWVRCVKMRGTNVDTRYYSMFHDGKEFNLALPLANQPF